MVKRKRTKGQTTIYKTVHIKQENPLIRNTVAYTTKIIPNKSECLQKKHNYFLELIFLVSINPFDMMNSGAP
jgi:hypothetical protein